MKKKRLLKFLKKWIDLILSIFGVVLMVFGTFLIYIPAGYILLGCCSIAAAIIYGLIHPEGK